MDRIAMKNSGRRNSHRLALLAAVAALCLMMVLMLAPVALAYDDQELAFLGLINNYRQQNGMAPLALDTKLSNAAFGHSADMAINNFFSHTGSNGSSPWDRIRAAGYDYNTSLGENIAAGYTATGDYSAQDVFTAWKNSPEHNANMLSTNYHAIGISRYYNPASYYHWYWTTDFGGVSEDVTPPSVAITYPGGTLVSGQPAFGVAASDDVAVVDVDLYIDNVQVAAETAPPYRYTWDTAGQLNGSQHTFTAVAHDSAGLTTTASKQVTVDNYTPARRYYFTWYDQQSPGLTNWVLMANPSTGSATARASILIGPTTYADASMIPGAAAQTPWFPEVIGGPVAVQTTQPLIASERTLYGNSFNETPAVKDTDLATTYYFTWYDSRAGDGMTGDWIMIANMGSGDASVEVDIGGAAKGPYTVPPGGIITPSYPNLADGPVRVTNLNSQPLIVSQRVIYRGSFSELLGVPESKLTTDYTFPWYDCTGFMTGDWILIGNQDTGDATVDVYIGNQKMHDPSHPANDFFTVPAGGRITPIFPGVQGGPVRVVSTNGKKLIVSQRSLYKNSFEELEGLTAADAGTDLWFTWYDWTAADSMAGNWIMVTNTGQGDASVDVYINGALKQQSVTIPAGTGVPLGYPGAIGGPVRLLSTSGQPLYVTQRVIYRNSFNEIAGIRF